MATACSGDRTALARLLSIVEQGGELAREAGRVAWPLGGRAYTVGITGAPGAGKSTLTDALIGVIRASGAEVAVLAIDPSSPFTGGAVLGDRVRMSRHFLDPGVFIRSMATRGHLGGLSGAAPLAVRTLDAAGFPWILLETVGVGQVEVEIAGEADTTVVVVNPGWGDALQASKAGLMEIADIFVVNKADRDGAERLQLELLQMLHLRPPQPWNVPVLLTSATTGRGLDELMDALAQHRTAVAVDPTRPTRERDRRAAELADLISEELRRRLDIALADRQNGLAALTAAVEAGTLDPYTATLELLTDDRIVRHLHRAGGTT